MESGRRLTRHSRQFWHSHTEAGEMKKFASRTPSSGQYSREPIVNSSGARARTSLRRGASPVGDSEISASKRGAADSQRPQRTTPVMTIIVFISRLVICLIVALAFLARRSRRPKRTALARSEPRSADAMRQHTASPVDCVVAGSGASAEVRSQIKEAAEAVAPPGEASSLEQEHVNERDARETAVEASSAVQDKSVLEVASSGEEHTQPWQEHDRARVGEALVEPMVPAGSSTASVETHERVAQETDSAHGAVSDEETPQQELEGSQVPTSFETSTNVISPQEIAGEKSRIKPETITNITSAPIALVQSDKITEVRVAADKAQEAGPLAAIESKSEAEIGNVQPAAPNTEIAEQEPIPETALGPPDDHPPATVPLEEAPETVSPILDEADILPAAAVETTTEAEPEPDLTGVGSDRTLRIPRQYQPRIGAVPPMSREKPRGSSAQPTQERALGIKVRVLFERGGSCNVSLVPERKPGLPDTIEVSDGLGSWQFAALQEDFYQDVTRDNIDSALRSGLELEQKPKRGAGARWSLSGRELFVLAAHSRLRGFVSVPRLVITDEEQLVLCTNELRAAVAEVLGTIGCTNCTSFDESTGIPEGWILFRGVRPKVTVPVSGEDSIFNVLCPQPDIEIVLEGGIRFQHSDWLAGFPPRIRIRGNFDAPVLIDGGQAQRQSDGIFASPDWDRPGQHVVTCAGVSRSYSIVQPNERWEPWPAYSFPMSRASKGSAICGAAILAGNSCKAPPILWVPRSNPVLLGANPGEVFRCRHRTDVTTDHWPVAVPFTPVWAVPIDPLHADKRVARIHLFGEAQRPPSIHRHIKIPTTTPKQMLEWASEILNSGRKGLAIEPSSSEVRGLWREYHLIAKTIWKACR